MPRQGQSKEGRMSGIVSFSSSLHLDIKLLCNSLWCRCHTTVNVGRDLCTWSSPIYVRTYVCVYIHMHAQIYMYIRDFPYVAAGGSMTAIGRREVGENVSVCWVRHSRYSRKAGAHPELLREESLFLWGFICLCVGLSNYVEAKIRMFLLGSILSFLEHA